MRRFGGLRALILVLPKSRLLQFSAFVDCMFGKCVDGVGFPRVVFK